MRKINLLALSVILTGRVCASSSHYYFELGRFLVGNDIRILPTVLLNRDVLEPDPVDFTIFMDGKIAILRIPLNPIIARGNNNLIIEDVFPRELIVNESASELVFAGPANGNVYILKKEMLNDNIPTNANRISLYVDKKDPQNPILEFLLRKNVKKTEKNIEAMVILRNCLHKYDRPDVAKDLESFGFLIDKTEMEE